MQPPIQFPPLGLSQAGRPMRLVTPLGDAFAVTAARGEEALNRPFRWEVDFVAPAGVPIAFDALLGQSATLSISQLGDTRLVNGIISQLRRLRVDREQSYYQLVLVPKLALLEYRKHCRIFQRQSVPDILRAVLEDLRPAVRLALREQHSVWDRCTQYEETDLAFVNRLCEEEGLVYTFEHTATGHTLVICDATSALPEIMPLRYNPDTGGTRTSAAITDWQVEQRLGLTDVAVRDWNFQLADRVIADRQPVPDQVNLGGEAFHLRALAGFARECYIPKAGYGSRVDGVGVSGQDQPDDLQRIFDLATPEARLHAQQEASSLLRVEAVSDAARLMPGRRVVCMNLGVNDGQYLIVKVVHQASTPQPLRAGGAGESGIVYTNRVELAPAAVNWRPPRVTPRPKLAGTHAATVVGAPGNLNVDRFGRVRVRFNWEQTGTASCWVRVSQTWAGKGYGAFFWPRGGNEVLVAFEQGDPDRPVIVGSVYNSVNIVPFELPVNKFAAGFKSCIVGMDQNTSFNGLLIHDEPGREFVQVHSHTHRVETTETTKYQQTEGPQVEFSGRILAPIPSGIGGGEVPGTPAVNAQQLTDVSGSLADTPRLPANDCCSPVDAPRSPGHPLEQRIIYDDEQRVGSGGGGGVLDWPLSVFEIQGAMKNEFGYSTTTEYLSIEGYNVTAQSLGENQYQYTLSGSSTTSGEQSPSNQPDEPNGEPDEPDYEPPAYVIVISETTKNNGNSQKIITKTVRVTSGTVSFTYENGKYENVTINGSQTTISEVEEEKEAEENPLLAAMPGAYKMVVGDNVAVYLGGNNVSHVVGGSAYALTFDPEAVFWDKASEWLGEKLEHLGGVFEKLAHAPGFLAALIAGIGGKVDTVLGPRVNKTYFGDKISVLRGKKLEFTRSKTADVDLAGDATLKLLDKVTVLLELATITSMGLCDIASKITAGIKANHSAYLATAWLKVASNPIANRLEAIGIELEKILARGQATKQEARLLQQYTGQLQGIIQGIPAAYMQNAQVGANQAMQGNSVMVKVLNESLTIMQNVREALKGVQTETTKVAQASAAQAAAGVTLDVLMQNAGHRLQLPTFTVNSVGQGNTLPDVTLTAQDKNNKGSISLTAGNDLTLSAGQAGVSVTLSKNNNDNSLRLHVDGASNGSGITMDVLTNTGNGPTLWMATDAIRQNVGGINLLPRTQVDHQASKYSVVTNALVPGTTSTIEQDGSSITLKCVAPAGTNSLVIDASGITLKVGNTVSLALTASGIKLQTAPTSTLQLTTTDLNMEFEGGGIGVMSKTFDVTALQSIDMMGVQSAELNGGLSLKLSGTAVQIN